MVKYAMRYIIQACRYAATRGPVELAFVYASLSSHHTEVQWSAHARICSDCPIAYMHVTCLGNLLPLVMARLGQDQARDAQSVYMQ